MAAADCRLPLLPSGGRCEENLHRLATGGYDLATGGYGLATGRYLALALLTAQLREAEQDRQPPPPAEPHPPPALFPDPSSD